MTIRIRKLTSNEAAQVFPKRRQMDLSEYTSLLRELQPGDSAELQLEGMSGRPGKRRVGQAAKQLGYRVKWARTTAADRLYFQVFAETSGRRRRRVEGGLARTGPAAASPRRRGRPRRRAAA